jgi:predicted RNase H-like nuclease (RuvC/YqgF family)
MEQKNSKIFSKETIQLVTAFCESQEIKDVSNFMYLCFKQGFDIKKYGFLGETEQEKIVEVPVEIIKEVEKIVEVPVEKVVTKIEYIRDENNENELGEKITKLEKEMSKKDEELDQLRRNLDIILDEPPVEIIKEVEKIVEVIKEVEKPNDRMEMLQETLLTLRKELQTKNERIKELEKINRDLENLSSQKGAVFLRGSNLNNRL